VPVVIPALGMLVCLILIGVRVASSWQKEGGYIAPVVALGIVAVALLLYFVTRPANPVAELEED
jgi:hypothetical protein